MADASSNSTIAAAASAAKTPPFPVTEALRFLESTEQFVGEGVNPGGYYKAVWCRDAAFILKDWFLAGRFSDVMQEILFIWSHQIAQDGEKVIYGRGSPEMGYASRVAAPDRQARFQGALPTTIFRGFSEVYGANPDIDSTALMISTSAWAFDLSLKARLAFPPLTDAAAIDGSGVASDSQALEAPHLVSNPSVVMEYVIPRMLKAVDYLAARDADGDGLLEQGHNEDWMDTVLRSGKVVYSQACWLLALANLSSLMRELGRDAEAARLEAQSQKAAGAVERLMWCEREGTYADLTEGKTLTQDVALYLVAVTENTARNCFSPATQRVPPELESRAASTLAALKDRVWKHRNNSNSNSREGGSNRGRWPLVTEAELKKTGPWKLHPNQYHNHTLWPWITGIEMQARCRFGLFGDCGELFTMLSSQDSGNPKALRALYEWINPVTDRGQGAFPFRTGISAIRVAIAEVVERMARESRGSS
ncbi:GH116 family glycosyl hydrolase [Nitrososphaera sp.]|uniref:GH116 family glycosyl hydrolase n=1 Tax=Nitrososphaera sp. TaxID=1971748 RepID=UPI00307D5165